MRLIAMFYLTVFASALLVSGLFSSQRVTSHPVSKTKVLVYASSSDTLPGAGVTASMEEAEPGPEVPENDKQDGSPLFFSFNFTSILQWILGLPSKSISLNSQPTPPAGQSIWLSIHNLRI